MKVSVSVCVCVCMPSRASVEAAVNPHFTAAAPRRWKRWCAVSLFPAAGTDGNDYAAFSSSKAPDEH